MRFGKSLSVRTGSFLLKCWNTLVTFDNEEIAKTLLALCADRGIGKTICPSQAGRILAEDQSTWRALMPDIRRVAHQLAS
jgi:hypothetical protein